MNYYNPPYLIFQRLPVKEIVKNIDFNRMRNGYTTDTLTSIDFQEIFKLGGKVIKIYDGVFYRKNFKISPLRKVIEKLFAPRQKYKDEANGLMQNLVKIIMNSLREFQLRRDIDEHCKGK